MIIERHEHIQAEISKTLGLLDQMQHLEVHHLFRVRLMQYIDAESGRNAKTHGLWGRFDLSLASLAMLILVNISSAMLTLRYYDSPMQARGNNELFNNLNDDDDSPEFAYFDEADANSPAPGITERRSP